MTIIRTAPAHWPEEIDPRSYRKVARRTKTRGNWVIAGTGDPPGTYRLVGGQIVETTAHGPHFYYVREVAE